MILPLPSWSQCEVKASNVLHVAVTGSRPSQRRSNEQGCGLQGSGVHSRYVMQL